MSQPAKTTCPACGDPMLASSRLCIKCSREKQGSDHNPTAEQIVERAAEIRQRNMAAMRAGKGAHYRPVSWARSQQRLDRAGM